MGVRSPSPRGMLTAAAAVAAVAAGCTYRVGDEGPSQAAAPRSEQPQLAVVRTVTGNPPRRDLVLVGGDGRTIRTLIKSRPGSFFAGGNWSPDGRRFAYAAGRETRSNLDRVDLVVVDASGSNIRRLTESGRAISPVWTPDGRSIVFTQFRHRPRPPGGTLWILDLAGGEPRPLLDEEAGLFDVASSFSPDASQLAFTRSVLAAPRGDARVRRRAAYLLDMETRELRKLADRAADPAFSPDGRRVAYVSDRDENGELSYGDAVFYANELYVMDADGGAARRLTRTRDLNEGAPSWSSDGRLIAVQRGRVIGNAEGTLVLTVHPDGSCARPVAFDRGLAVWYAKPVWRPGRQLGDADLTCRSDRAPRPASVLPAGNLTLAQARSFGPFALYWLGNRWEGLVHSSLSHRRISGPRGSGSVVHVHYGTLTIQHWPACVRVPADVDLPPDKRMPIRGVEGVFFEGGHRLELVTGKTTIVIFGGRGQIARAAQALRPVGVQIPPRRGDILPAAAPGAVAGKLGCR